MSQILQVLEGARALIAQEENWCKNAYGKVSDDGIRSWCATGAVAEASRRVFGAMVVSQNPVIQALKRQLPPDSFTTVVWFNDCANTTHEDVLALFDRTIENEKESLTSKF